MARAAIPQTENDVLQSEAMASAPWSPFTGITIFNNTLDLLDPNGGNTATKMVYDGSGAAGGIMLLQAFANSLGGEPNAIGIWVRLASGGANILITENVSLAFTTTAISSSAWTFVSRIATSNAVGGVHLDLYRDGADNAPRTWYLAFAQGAAGKNRLGPYAKTTGAAIPGPIRDLATGRIASSGRVAASGRITP